MKKLRANLIMAGILCTALIFILSQSAYAQDKATLTGKVTDSESGDPLPGANVLVTSSNVQTGAATNTSGEYTVRNIPPGTYTVTISYIGYEKSVSENVSLASGESKALDVVLILTSIDINPIVATASRRQEKTLDAPASISVIEPREIAQDVSTSSSVILRKVVGVDVSQTGVDRSEIVMRGFNNAFSGESYVLTDNRQAAVASLGVNIHSIMPNQATDLDRVEIVRGPAAALYGPGVDEGVIHYITKDPFNYPGTTVSFAGGERSALSLQFRHAGVGGGRVGYKLTGQFAQANDWELNPNDALDAVQLALDRPGIQRDYDYQKLNINGMLQFKLSDDATLTANGGYGSLNAVVLTGVGTAQADGFGYVYGQLRLQAGNFFAQTYINRNNLGDSFIYSRTSGLTDLVDESTVLNVQAQYNHETWNGKQQLIFGFDYDRTTPNTKGTIIGRFEDRDLISETGAYIQSQTAFSEKFDFIVALRGDYNNLQDEFIIAPRIAAVLKPTPEHSFRASFNRAASSPGVTENFLDIQVGVVPGTNIPVRGLGSAFGYNFDRSSEFGAFANSDLVAYSLNPATLGQPQPVGLPLDATYASVFAGLNKLAQENPAAIRAQLPPNLQPLASDAFIQQFVGLLDPSLTQVTGFSQGALGLANLTTGDINIVNDVTDIKPLDLNITQTLEFGYKGLIEDRVLFAIDAYYTKKEDFVGPLIVESPFVLVPTLAQDLTTALTTGLQNNAQLGQLLGQLPPGILTPEGLAQLIVGLAAADNPATNPLANPVPVAIVAPRENAPSPGEVPELMLAYRNFGEVDFWGVDASLQVLATDRLTLFGNLSWVSDDFFDNKELNETNTSLSVALNAPSFKTKFGFSYNVPFGISVNSSARFIKGFPVESGPYVGDIDDYFLLDLGFGYDMGRMAPGMRFDITIQNVLDNMHREFIGAPEIGRLGMARITYSR